MSEDDIGYVETFVSDIYVPLEGFLHDGALENAIKDLQHPVWTIFDKTGEIITGYAYEQEIWDKRDSLGLTEDEFQKTYGEPVYYDNKYDADGMTAELKKTQEKIQDPAFRQDFDDLITLVGKMADAHDEKYVYETEAILHDMYHYLFHYGPELALTSDDPGQTPAFYGVLNVYQSADQ